MRGYADLRTLKWRQKEAGLPINLFGDKMLFLALELDRLLNDRHGDLQEGRRCLNEFIVMDRTVAIFGKFLEDMTHAGMRADDRIPWNPESLRQAIRRLEANAVNIEGQAIRILLDAGNGFVAIDFVNADSPCGPDAVGVQEDHNFPDDFLGVSHLLHIR